MHIYIINSNTLASFFGPCHPWDTIQSQILRPRDASYIYFVLLDRSKKLIKETRMVFYVNDLGDEMN